MNVTHRAFGSIALRFPKPYSLRVSASPLRSSRATGTSRISTPRTKPICFSRKATTSLAIDCSSWDVETCRPPARWPRSGIALGNPDLVSSFLKAAIFLLRLPVLTHVHRILMQLHDRVIIAS
jgi:hypothetical protein